MSRHARTAKSGTSNRRPNNDSTAGRKVTEGCILCANGNDLPEGEYCRGCGREGEAIGLRAAVIKARGRQVPPETPVIFDDTPERARVAYDTFRRGFRGSAPLPHWDEAPAWMRDVVRVAYLQGALDGNATALTAGK